MWKGPSNDNMHPHTQTHRQGYNASVWKVNVNPWLFFICRPLRELKNITSKLFLRGDRKDCHTEVFSALALIRLVMVKQRGAP